MALLASIPPAALLALCAAMLFGLGINCTKLGLAHLEAGTGTVLSIGTSTALYWLAAPFVLSLADLAHPAVLLFAAIGLFRPFVSANLANRGTHALGPTISQTVASTAPFWGLMGGVLVLGEQATAPVLLATASIVAGIVALSWRGRTPPAWSVWALGFPLGAALIRSGAHVATKGGLELLPSPLLATAAASTVSLLVGLGEGTLRGRWRQVRGKGIGVRWFAVTGVINGTSVLLINTALLHGTVVTVSPIVATSPMFTLLFSRLLFRSEALTWRTLLGVALVVPGVVLITVYR